MLVVYLLKQRTVGPQMSCYQIMKATLNFLATHDFRSTPLSLCDAQDPQQLADFQTAFDMVFVDPSGLVNLCGRVTLGCYMELQHEAALSMALISSNPIAANAATSEQTMNDSDNTDGNTTSSSDSDDLESFQALFITKVPFHSKFDHLLTVRAEQAQLVSILQKCTPKLPQQRLTDFDFFAELPAPFPLPSGADQQPFCNVISKSIYHPCRNPSERVSTLLAGILRAGFGSRAPLLQRQRNLLESTGTDASLMTFGLLLDADTAYLPLVSTGATRNNSIRKYTDSLSLCCWLLAAERSCCR